METREQNTARTEALIRGLREQMDPLQGPEELCLVGLQEANPVRKLSRILAHGLHCKKKVAEANVGLRIGNFSYPFYLQEGLACLWSPQSFKKVRSERLTISDPIPEFKVILGKWKFPISLQLAERRVALFMKGYLGDTKIGLANVHLHHGIPDARSNPRRMSELRELFHYIDDEIAKCDLFFLLGDFNCEQEHEEYALLKQKGFVELSLGPQGERLITWDKNRNPLCHKTSALDLADLKTLEWDAQLHQFDHIFVRESQSPGALSGRLKSTPFRLFEDDRHGAWVSDHFGLGVDILWD